MLDWLRNLDVASLLLGGLIGMVLSTWHSYYVKRPKLKLIGGGGGSVTLSNVPGFFGLSFRNTVILGKLVHSDKEFGLPIDRDPARECVAVLIDKETGQHIAGLFFQLNDGTTLSTITLNSGEKISLLVFNKAAGQGSTYYPWRPDNNDSKKAAPLTDADPKFDDTREFNVLVRYAYGRKKFEFTVKMIRGFDGRLSFYSPVGGGTF